MNRKNGAFSAVNPSLSIIIPVLNEAEAIVRTLSSLVESIGENRIKPVEVQIIVVDGGSNDGSAQIAREFLEQKSGIDYTFQLLQTDLGRAKQMNKGAATATGNMLVFLHADTIVPENFASELAQVSQSHEHAWGRFDVSLSGRHPMLRCVEWFINYRSRLTSVATGDQAIFVRHQTFKELGGFADIPLMEDVEISKRLKKLAPPYCSSLKLVTSSRRWERGGIYNTIFLMWRLRYAYYRGADPRKLAKQYVQSK